MTRLREVSGTEEVRDNVRTHYPLQSWSSIDLDGSRGGRMGKCPKRNGLKRHRGGWTVLTGWRHELAAQTCGGRVKKRMKERKRERWESALEARRTCNMPPWHEWHPPSIREIAEIAMTTGDRDELSQTHVNVGWSAITPNTIRWHLAYIIRSDSLLNHD